MLRSMIFVKTPPRVSTPRESGCNVEKHTYQKSPCKDSSLNSSAYRDTLHWIDAPLRLFPKDVLDKLLNEGHFCLSADEYDLVDLSWR